MKYWGLSFLAGRFPRHLVKKYFAIFFLFGVYLHWDDITRFVAGPSEFESAGGGVVLYATEWCGYCEKTRELFADHNIQYVEYDIEKSPQAHSEYKRLGGRGVPVVNANGTVIHGYAPAQILAAAGSN